MCTLTVIYITGMIWLHSMHERNSSSPVGFIIRLSYCKLVSLGWRLQRNTPIRLALRPDVCPTSKRRGFAVSPAPREQFRQAQPAPPYGLTHQLTSTQTQNPPIHPPDPKKQGQAMGSSQVPRPNKKEITKTHNTGIWYWNCMESNWQSINENWYLQS